MTNKLTPPLWPGRLLRWMCDPELIDEIEGDLAEMFHAWVVQHGVSKARRRYIFHTLKFIRPFIFRRKKNYTNNPTDMLSNYFKISRRNLARNKAFTLINVLGLSLGMGCVILIYALISYHLSFDTFHPNRDRLYRVVTEYRFDVPEVMQWVPQPLGKAFRNDFTFGEKVARVRTYRSVIISFPESNDDRKFKEDNMVGFAESSFFEMFSIPQLFQSKGPLLTEPNTCLLTKSKAIKYFGSEDVIGKMMRVMSRDKAVDFRITGVLADVPTNTDLRTEIYLSYYNLKDYNAYYASDDSWGSINTGMSCYVLLKPGVGKADVDAAFPTLVKKYNDGSDERLCHFFLQPLSEVHFDPAYGGTFNKKYLWVFGLTGFFLIAIACVNFINLATAQILNRTKEAGIRKVMGSFRSQLFLQFITETGMIALIAVVIACVMAQTVLPAVNALIGERIEFDFFAHWQLPAFIVSILLFTVFASGTYPAILMTRFQPVQALRNSVFTSKQGGFSIRRSLIVAQFIVAQILIICMLIISQQMDYAASADLGFNKEGIVLLTIPVSDMTKTKALNKRLAAVPGVVATTLCYEAPAALSNNSTSIRYHNPNEEEPWEVNLKDGDDQFIPMFGLKLVAGRNLLPADSVKEFVVNETLVRKLGFASPQDALGQRIAVNGGYVKGTIEGVVKDFHNASFHEVISPIAIMTNYDRFRTYAIKLDLREARPALDMFNRLWSETYPNHVFTYEFVDDRIDSMYRTDDTMLTLIKSVAVIAIVISCLGLYGLVSFMSTRRIKEIGIRKVLGAGVSHILLLFGKEFMVLIIVAFALAAPVSWFLMRNWLDGFVYKIPVSPASFLFAIIGTVVVAALTVSYHSLRSALSNPANGLRE